MPPKSQINILTEDNLKQSLRTNITGGWFLYGDEEYLISYYANEIRKNVIGNDDFGEFNRIVIDSQKIDVGEIEDALSSLPMMSDRKIVEILYPYLYKKDKKKKDDEGVENTTPSSEDDEDMNDDLINVISHLSDYPHAVLLIVVNKDCFFEGVSANAPSALLKNIAKYMNVVRFPLQNEAKLRKWIESHVKREGLSISYDALDFMLNLCGQDMRNLKNEIDKLVAYSLANKITNVDINTIKAVVSPGLEEGSFELSNAITRGQRDKAYDALLGYKLRKEPALVVLASISSTISDMLKVATLNQSGLNAAQIEKILGMNSFRVSNYLKSVNGIELERLRVTLERCRQADEYMKTKSMDYEAIERLIATIPQFGKIGKN